MPPSLLPPRIATRASASSETTDAATRIVTWRLHVREISIDGLPSRTSVEREWDGLLLRFVAEWSRETKRTTATNLPGSHTWSGEHAMLTLPPPSGSGVPESQIAVELCATTAGEPDEIVGVARVSIASQTASVRALELIGPLFRGRGPTVSFRLDSVGITHAMAEREWGADAAVAEGGPPPAGTDVMPPAGRGGRRPRTAPVAYPPDEDEDGYIEGGGERRGAAPAASSISRSAWHGHAAQPTTPLAYQLLEEAGYAPPAPLPPPSLSTEPTILTFNRKAQPPPPSAARPAQQRTQPPRPPPYAFGSSSATTRGPLLPGSSGGGRAPSAAKTPALARPPHQTKAELLLRPVSAPSARLLLQLDECARIKECFAKYGLPCPTGVLERGLLLPEDSPEELCRLQLPPPSRLRPGDMPMVVGKGKKGKKGKGKGRSKSPKKKK